MMLAEAGTAGGDFVLGVGEVGAQAHRFVLGRAHAPERQVHPRQRLLALDEAEALRDHQLERQPEQFVEHARCGLAGIILDRDDPEERARRRPGGPELNRLLAEAYPAIGEVSAEILLGQQHRAHLAIVERGEEFERLRARPLRARIDAEQPRPRNCRAPRSRRRGRCRAGAIHRRRRPRRSRPSGRAPRESGRARRPGPAAGGAPGSGTIR